MAFVVVGLVLGCEYWKGLKDIEWLWWWWGSNDDGGGEGLMMMVVALKRWRTIQLPIGREYRDMYKDIEIEIALWLITIYNSLSVSLVSDIITKIMVQAFSYPSSYSVKKMRFSPYFYFHKEHSGVCVRNSIKGLGTNNGCDFFARVSSLIDWIY